MEQGEYTMNSAGSNQDNEQKAVEAAWDRLQTQLVKEPVNSQWARWSKQQQEQNISNVSIQDLNMKSTSITDSGLEPLTASSEAAAVSHEKAYAKRKNSWFIKNRKWISGIAAASVLAVAIISPAGNQALAAILNQFHMQQLTVVKADDIQAVTNKVFTDGQSHEAMNKFGAISSKSGTINGEYNFKEAEQLLNRKLIAPSDFAQSNEKVNVSASYEVTLTLNVNEVNKTLKRLGATKLLPSSIDGKPITLKMDETVNYSKQIKLNGKQRYYSFTQQAVPVIVVDPSISLPEALDAVIQFPLLPDDIKFSLKASGVLNGGNIPLPVVTYGSAEKLTIQGVEAVLTVDNYDTKGQGNTTYYMLKWIKNGQLYSINGDGFADRNAVIALADELIKQ
jgi:hypothetical protein